MIRIFIDNEQLEIPIGTLVTFKRSQNLNGIQNQYSYSNTVNVPDSPKNRRLLGINYLPNSKAKAMTYGKTCNVVFNDCIFLKNQTLKVQKESKGSIPVYLVFTDSAFTAKTKATALNEINLDLLYTRTLSNFTTLNASDAFMRTAPISAQAESGLIVVEEVNPLLNIKLLVEKIILELGYNVEGDFFTDTEIPLYYTNANVGVYGTDAAPYFDPNLTVLEFLTNVLKTFNAFIDVSDSGKSAGVYLWKNIETIKKNFVDYSRYFVDFNEYSFEAGLAKKNTMSYSDSDDFYNGYFENNKSIVATSEYLKSDFGAGGQRLYDDSEIQEGGLILLRDIGFTSEPSTMNLYRFESLTTEVTVYYEGNPTGGVSMYKAYTPNIFEIWDKFHKPYTKNISLPALANFTFKYDAIFLSEFKMQEVFFIKQLSSYWLPLEQNYSTAKDKVTIKALMIEKTAVQIPVVFDLNISLGFQELYTIPNAGALYSSLNRSPQSSFIVSSFDASENKVFITGSDLVETEITSTPFNIDVSTNFQLRFENKDTINHVNTSTLLFQFVSEEGGFSRVAKINITHNGVAKYYSEFISPLDVESNFYGSLSLFRNISIRDITIFDIPTTYTPNIGSEISISNVDTSFRTMIFDKAQYVKCILDIGYAYYSAESSTLRIDQTPCSVNVKYQLFKNGILFKTLHSNGAYAAIGKTVVKEENNILKTYNFSVVANDRISIVMRDTRTNGILNIYNNMVFKIKNIKWRFECTENL